MSFLETITDDQLDTLRPDIFKPYTKMISAIRARMRLRRYELVTFACLLQLKCST